MMFIDQNCGSTCLLIIHEAVGKMNSGKCVAFSATGL
jgi:hypothetical protein